MRFHGNPFTSVDGCDKGAVINETHFCLNIHAGVPYVIVKDFSHLDTLPTITSQEICAVICDGKIIAKKCKSTISTSRPPFLHLTGHAFECAEKRNKHISIQGIPNKPCTV